MAATSGGEHTTTNSKPNPSNATPKAGKERTNTNPDTGPPTPADTPEPADPYAGWSYRPDDPDIVAMVAKWELISPQIAAQIARILDY